ncbi:MAG: DNA polymerase III subunit alpha, partial [Acidobacteriota bacterium]
MDQLNFKSKDFVHLHLHSDYSLLQSTIKLKPLAECLKEHEMKACAITDYGNMYGAISFYSTMATKGIRPIIGYEAFVASGSRHDKGSTIKAGELPYYNLVLLAADLEGYQNLVYLSSKGFTEGLYHKPRIDVDLLAEKAGGLIALSAGPNGAIQHFLRTGNVERAAETAGRYREIFGMDNFLLEIQDHQADQSASTIKAIRELSRKDSIPLVATNDAHYLTESDARAHEVLLCIGEGRTLTEGSRYTFPSSKYYLRTADEMWQLFGAEIPESLNNTLLIAERCKLDLPLGDDNLTLPVFPIPADSEAATAYEYFDKVVGEGFEARKQNVWLPLQAAGVLKYELDNYEKRLERERDVIRVMGFTDYFLIVWDFIRYAKQCDIPVGPGRGSAAGSLIAYCLGITDIDPLQYDLLFERFLNPERISMPDIDIDFCIRGRARVIEHVTEFYGRESVCQIITFGTMASKAAIKDVGRALNMPYGEVEKVAKMMPPPVRGRNISISQALLQVPELKSAVAADPKIKDLVELALRVEGCSRHSSVHAAGVVISPRPLHEIVPVAISAKDELTSQYPMNDLEKVGMLKMDFLALTTLTIIDDCLRSLHERKGISIDWSAIPLNDEKTMKLFGDGHTDAVFQFESSGMQEICRKLKPKELEDLSALNALYRPGPIDGGMIDDYIARHRGEKRVQYLVPEMKEILSNTYGVLVYQEQIMQLAQKLAGYSLGEADMMRRAMGKKKREEMAIHAEKFVSGAVERNVDRKKAEEIFNLMSQFADYGFNRSHSIAYAYLAFQTAYLKAHYTAHFYAAVLSHECNDAAKVYKYSSELRGMGLKMLPPDVNESDEGFTPSDDLVRFGLGAIKGIGSSTVNAIIDARSEGRFSSFMDFVTRVEPGSLGRRVLESLITSGSFDTLMPAEEIAAKWRASLFAGIENALSISQKEWNDRLSGQIDLFGSVQSGTREPNGSLPDVPSWSEAELSRLEKASIGFYLSVHPLDNYQPVLKELGVTKIVDPQAISAGEILTIAGIVSASQIRYSKKGNRFCIFKLEDQTVTVKCLVWAEAFTKHSNLIKDDELLIVSGRVESADGGEITLVVSEIRLLADEVPRNAREVVIGLPSVPFGEDYLFDLFSVLNSASGNCSVQLQLPLEGLRVKLSSQPIRIQGSSYIENELRKRGCDVQWL